MILKKISIKDEVVVLFIADQKYFLNYSDFARYDISIGDSLPDQIYNEIVVFNELYQIKVTALNFLKRRDYTSLEITNKLVKKGFQKKNISKIIDEFILCGFIDNYRVAESYIQYYTRIKKYGINKIKKVLSQKGISREIIVEILKNYDCSDLVEKNLENLIIKKINQVRRKTTEKDKIKIKVINSMILKGYEFDIVNKVINNIL